MMRFLLMMSVLLFGKRDSMRWLQPSQPLMVSTIASVEMP